MPDLPPHLLLRSSWQTVNIGDIAHTPGAIALIQEAIPEATITLWPSHLDRGVETMLKDVFPRLNIVRGDTDDAGRPLTPELQAAFTHCDILIHGSGPSLVAGRHLLAWNNQTGKPYGLFGVTLDPFAWGADGNWEGYQLDEAERRLTQGNAPVLDSISQDILKHASFAFFRDTLSLRYAQAYLPQTVKRAFGPDATFACSLRDDSRADTWLACHGLEAGRYLVAIPRLRWTPYHEIHGTEARPQDLAKQAVSQRTFRQDHAAVGELIQQWIQETGMPVIIAPEMTYQVQLAKTVWYDPMPASLRSKIIWRDRYWLTDEATSVYARAHTLVSLENHSPILALAQSTPAIMLRQPTDTFKGQMWRDIGMEDWFMEIDEATPERLWSTVAMINADRNAAIKRTKAIMSRVTSHHKVMTDTLMQLLA